MALSPAAGVFPACADVPSNVASTCAIASGRSIPATTVPVGWSSEVGGEPTLGHRASTAAQLLCGLKKDHEPPLEVARSDRLEDGDPPCHVDVVTAGVHRAVYGGAEPGLGRSVVLVGRLRDQETVDVHPQADRRSRTAVEDGDAPGDAAAGAFEDVGTHVALPRSLDPRLDRLRVGDGHAVGRIVRLSSDRQLVDPDGLDLLDESGRRLELAPPRSVDGVKPLRVIRPRGTRRDLRVHDDRVRRLQKW
jgi:hypothetical protein